MPNPDTRVPRFGSSQTRKPGLGKNPPGLDSLVSMDQRTLATDQLCLSTLSEQCKPIISSTLRPGITEHKKLQISSSLIIAVHYMLSAAMNELGS